MYLGIYLFICMYVYIYIYIYTSQLYLRPSVPCVEESAAAGVHC